MVSLFDISLESSAAILGIRDHSSPYLGGQWILKVVTLQAHEW